MPPIRPTKYQRLKDRFAGDPGTFQHALFVRARAQERPVQQKSPRQPPPAPFAGPHPQP